MEWRQSIDWWNGTMWNGMETVLNAGMGMATDFEWWNGAMWNEMRPGGLELSVI